MVSSGSELARTLYSFEAALKELPPHSNLFQSGALPLKGGPEFVGKLDANEVVIDREQMVFNLADD